MTNQRMKFSCGAIRDHVNTYHIGDKVMLQDIKYFTDIKNRNDLEDKAVQLIILSCKAPGLSPNTAKTSMYNSNKKILLNKAYHRFFLCADAKNPPHCFALITTSMSQTHQLLANHVDESFLGVSFYLLEPNISTSKMGRYLPVFTCEDNTLLPLNPSDSSLDKLSRIELPSGTDETFYFLLDNQKIDVSRIRSPTDVSCTGLQCDRQKKKGECVCIQYGPGFPLVYSFDICFEVDPKAMNGETAHVSTFRSYRTTGVFFRNFAEYSSTTTIERELYMQKKRRKQMHMMVGYINNNGGWKIIGWCKKGEVKVEGETEKVENNDVNLNLSYVYPCREKIFETQEFQDLQIYDDFNEMNANEGSDDESAREQSATLITNMEGIPITTNNGTASKEQHDSE